MSPSGIGIGILGIVGLILAVAIAVLLIAYLIVPLFKGMAWVVARLFRFVVGMLSDAVRFIGAVLAMILFAPLVLINIVIGRWSASAHFAGAAKSELAIAGACFYRFCIGHPCRLFGLTGLVEGIEQRFPQAVAQAPTADGPKGSGRAGQFEGYKIVGSLPTGGSGSKLYIAEPDPIKRAALERSGFRDIDQVVIKNFPVTDGSNLPNIVRESRALEAAKRLGLVLDHELSPAKFYYVMRYVPGQTLNVVIQQMHAQSDPTLQGLDNRHLASTLGYVGDLVAMLNQYHEGGLWHKDVKPENIIVEQLSGRPRAHLVDFGLVTPLRSAMTLTTHGTEYFRDPELVRLALRGVKVHEVDGTKFDIYAAGAVLFASMENSFPAHGVLSQVTRRCPETVKWIIRRAMADYDKRYASAAQMLTDLNFVRAAADPFALKPIDLPSMRAGGVAVEVPLPREEAVFAGGPSAGPVPESVRVAAAYASPVGPSSPPPRSNRPDIRLLNWWTGEHVVVPEAPPLAGAPGNAGPFGFDVSGFQDAANRINDKAFQAVDRAFEAAGMRANKANAANVANAMHHAREQIHGARRTAREQIEAARARVQSKREAIKARRKGWPIATGRYDNKPRAGSFIGSIILIAGIVFVVSMIRDSNRRSAATAQAVALQNNVAEAVAAARQAIDGTPVFPAASIRRDGAMETIRIISASEKPEKPAAKSTSKSKRAKTVPTPAPVPEVAPDLHVNGVSALFVSDLPSPVSPETRKLIDSVVERLRTTGFALTGDTPDFKAEDHDTVERLAEARVAASGVEVASSEFRDRLSAWAKEKNLDLVVWLRPQLDSTGKADTSKPPMALIIAAETAPDDVRNAARDVIAVALKGAK